MAPCVILHHDVLSILSFLAHWPYDADEPIQSYVQKELYRQKYGVHFMFSWG